MSEVKELKLYLDWEEIISKETGLIVYDPDGYRMLCDEGKEGNYMTKDEATYYFMHNTVISKERA